MTDILIPSPGGHIRLCYFREGAIWRPGVVDASGRLQVRGEDQLFSFKDTVRHEEITDPVAAGLYSYNSPAVPPDTVWVITSVCGKNDKSVCTHIRIRLTGPSGTAYLEEKVSPAVFEAVTWSGWAVLVAGDRVRIDYFDCALNDVLVSHIGGFSMTPET